MSFKCPCCGSELAELPIETLMEAPISPLAKRILSVLITAYPLSMTREILAREVYMNAPQGGPLSATEVIGVTMHHANLKLVPLGWRMGARASGKREDVALRRVQ